MTAFSASAQSEFTAYSLSKWQPEGTARSASMGNAFTALGGDLGAIGINPASSAVYRYSEFSMTPTVSNAQTKSDYFGHASKENRTTFGLSNLGMVYNFKTGAKKGLVSCSFAVTYNKLNNFNTTTRAYTPQNNSDSYIDAVVKHTSDGLNYSGASVEDMDMNDNQDPFSYFNAGMWPDILAWNSSLVDSIHTVTGVELFPVTSGNSIQNYKRKSYGSSDETNINFGLNFSNKLYLGFNVGVNTVWNKIEEQFDEDNTGGGDFIGMSQYYNQKTYGSGFTIKTGLIYTPTPFLRFGATISTPTWLYLTDKYYWDMSADFEGSGSVNHPRLYSPEGSFDYTVTSPFRYGLGAAITFKKGAFSLDYEGANLSQMRINSRNNSHGGFVGLNRNFKDFYKNCNTIRAGLEITPIESLALRAGFQYSDSGIKDVKVDNYTVSLGAGYSNPCGFFADLAFLTSAKKQSVVFDTTNLVESYVMGGATTVKRSIWKAMLTIGFRF